MQGIKTIGYGHACHVNDCSTIHPPITVAQGEALLRQDLVTHQNCVQAQVPFVNDNQFAAVCLLSLSNDTSLIILILSSSPSPLTWDVARCKVQPC